MYSMFQKSSKIRRINLGRSSREKERENPEFTPLLYFNELKVSDKVPYRFATTSKAFITGLKRFVARRCKPSEVFCVQGTNFYAASRDLRKEFRQLMKEDVVHLFLVTYNITFHFNPPSAPHFGGIWEATVKSFKFHLNTVVGVTSLTFEELSTLSSQIEAYLNYRSLCLLSSSPDDSCVLTPGHFLIGKSLTAIPQPTVPDDLRHCDR
ncbi:integrase catalytic domain-containing protein [Trichonephila clavipes]|nr:integrase catalytic domain-containing protein [Trichonephila clavipes]